MDSVGDIPGSAQGVEQQRQQEQPARLFRRFGDNALAQSADEGIRISEGGEGPLRQLTAETAHDFNNLLSVILSCASELELNFADVAVRERAEEIRVAAQRGARLTRQLIDATRPEAEEQPPPLDINLAVHGASRLLARTLGAGIRLTTVPGNDLPSVMISPAQVEQILLNLAGNARDAMHGYGVVTVRTSSVGIGSSDPVLGPGWYVRLSVSDNGPGMDSETLARALEPYFTTKAGNHGTGLGLPTVAGIAREAGGEVRLWTVPGEGTTVSVYLPAARRTGEPTAAGPQSGSGIAP